MVSDPLPSAELEDGVLGEGSQTWVRMSDLPLTRVTPGDSGQLLTPLRAVPPTEVSHKPRRSF